MFFLSSQSSKIPLKGTKPKIFRLLYSQFKNVIKVSFFVDYPVQYSVHCAGGVQRDILIHGEEVTRDLIATALQHTDSTLELEVDTSYTEFGKYYKQGNTAASRKFILPYVKKLTSSLN